jgi:hypothetical protein
MKHNWLIEPSDIEKVKAFLDRHGNDAFVRQRIEWNLRDHPAPVQRADFWRQMAACLLTTQQRAGPTSAVSRFVKTHPFPLAYETCLGRPNVEEFARDTLTRYGGLRRTGIVAGEIARNLTLLEQGMWDRTLQALGTLRTDHSIPTERKVAEFIDDKFAGFGPKQSRNLLQSLGLTRGCGGRAGGSGSASGAASRTWRLGNQKPSFRPPGDRAPREDVARTWGGSKRQPGR